MDKIDLGQKVLLYNKKLSIILPKNGNGMDHSYGLLFHNAIWDGVICVLNAEKKGIVCISEATMLHEILHATSAREIEGRTTMSNQ